MAIVSLLKPRLGRTTLISNSSELIWSMLTLQNTISSEALFASCSKYGEITLQGLHQEAQKSITTALPWLSLIYNNCQTFSRSESKTQMRLWRTIALISSRLAIFMTGIFKFGSIRTCGVVAFIVWPGLIREILTTTCHDEARRLLIEY